MRHPPYTRETRNNVASAFSISNDRFQVLRRTAMVKDTKPSPPNTYSQRLQPVIGVFRARSPYRCTVSARAQYPLRRLSAQFALQQVAAARYRWHATCLNTLCMACCAWRVMLPHQLKTHRLIAAINRQPGGYCVRQSDGRSLRVAV